MLCYITLTAVTLGLGFEGFSLGFGVVVSGLGLLL